MRRPRPRTPRASSPSRPSPARTRTSASQSAAAPSPSRPRRVAGSPSRCVCSWRSPGPQTVRRAVCSEDLRALLTPCCRPRVFLIRPCTPPHPGEVQLWLDGAPALHATGLALRGDSGTARVRGMHVQTFFGGALRSLWFLFPVLLVDGPLAVSAVWSAAVSVFRLQGGCWC